MSVAHALERNARDPDQQKQAARNRGLIELLASWSDASSQEQAEQQETWEYLKHALDDDRQDGAKLFS